MTKPRGKGSRKMEQHCTHKFVDFTSDNPAFNRDKFVDACEYTL